jgi:hypothetical protein
LVGQQVTSTHRSASGLQLLAPGQNQGNATFEIATMAAWESPAAIAAARAEVNAFYARIGFDMPAAIASWGVTLQRAICSAPADLQ